MDKIYYHGSNSKFTTFDKSKIKENKLGLCFNFTDDYSMAYQYGDNILKVHLDLNNPLTEEIFNTKWTYEQDNMLAKKLGFPGINKEDFDDTETFGDVYEIFKMDPRFIELLEEMGYDGIAFPEEHHFGVFEPEQIHIIQNEQKVYHGSREKFDKFDLNKFQRGDYGYGIYFTHDKAYASDYGTVNQYEIPDMEYLLDWEATWEYQSEYVYDCLDKLFDDLYNNDRDNWEKIMEIVDRGYGNDGQGLYMNLSEILKLTPQQTSELLYKYGIKGIDSFKGNCQVIFNPEDIKFLTTITEKFEEIERNVWATNSGYDIINRMKNKKAPYRMIWDNNIRYYFIGDAFDYIHQDILEHAYYNGFYPDMLSANECDDYMNKNMETNNMILFAFDPDGGGLLDQEKSSDGYTRKYVYDFGTIYAHEFTPFEKCPLYDLLGEPIKKENIFESYIKIKGNSMSIDDLNKFLDEVEFDEDMGALGAAPCPAACGPVTSTGCTVNGIPVGGQSVKKKKKSKKSEAFFTKEQLSPTKVTPEEMIEMVEETFDPEEVLQTIVKNNREIIKVTVCYDNPNDRVLTHLLHLEYLDIDEETVIDEVTETELSIQDCKDELVYIFSSHEAIDGEMYENVVDSELEEYIHSLLNEDFNEAYERITDLIAKQLDKMNFTFANTEDIIYKKEGDYKYLFKFDNEIGIIKIKVEKDDEVLVEKEWQLDEEDDVEPIFKEIEQIYSKYGV